MCFIKIKTCNILPMKKHSKYNICLSGSPPLEDITSIIVYQFVTLLYWKYFLLF